MQVNSDSTTYTIPSTPVCSTSFHNPRGKKPIFPPKNGFINRVVLISFLEVLTEEKGIIYRQMRKSGSLTRFWTNFRNYDQDQG